MDLDVSPGLALYQVPYGSHSLLAVTLAAYASVVGHPLSVLPQRKSMVT